MDSAPEIRFYDGVVSTLEASTALWQAAGLQQVQTRQISVRRRFDRFDEYWDSVASSHTLRPMLDALSATQLAERQGRVRERLQAGRDGPLEVSARANAVRGLKP